MDRSRLLVAFGLAPQPDGSKYLSWVSSRLYAAMAVLLVLVQVIRLIGGLHGAWAWVQFVVLCFLIVSLAVSVRDLRRLGR